MRYSVFAFERVIVSEYNFTDFTEGALFLSALEEVERLFLRLDSDLESFIEEHVNSFIKWDLVVFFHNNPESKETAEEIASLLGRKESDIETALKELVQSKLVSSERIVNKDHYYYKPPRQMAEMVSQFVSCLDSREKRLLVLTKLLRLEASR